MPPPREVTKPRGVTVALMDNRGARTGTCRLLLMRGKALNVRETGRRFSRARQKESSVVCERGEKGRSRARGKAREASTLGFAHQRAKSTEYGVVDLIKKGLSFRRGG